MIPYPYNMVDMGGIDLAEANGTVVEGLYSKIVEAVNACGDVVLYNWKFAGIEIAPQHTSILLGDPITINGAVQVTEQDLVTVPGINPDPPPPLVLVPLSVTENGQFSPQYYDADGFSQVDVEVPIPAPGKYLEVIPDYLGLSAGFLGQAGSFEKWTAVTNYVEYATLSEGKYIVCIGETVGNRFRAALFPSKSFSDFEPYISEASAQSGTVYSAETPITPTTGLSGDGLTRRFLFQATGGVCVIMTSSNSQVSKPILLKIQEE